MDVLARKQELLNAVNKGDLTRLKNLLGNDANVNTIFPNGKTLLMMAIESEDGKIVEFLLQKGVDVDQRDFYDHTPLMYAADQGFASIARSLIDAGADLNIRNKQGKTALMYAAYKGNVNVARVLLDAGAEINTKDNNDRTALDYSLYKKNNTCRNLFEELGAEGKRSHNSWERIRKFLTLDIAVDEFAELKNSPKWNLSFMIQSYILLGIFLCFLAPILFIFLSNLISYIEVLSILLSVWISIKIFPSTWKIFPLGLEISKMTSGKKNLNKPTRGVPTIHSGSDMEFVSTLMDLGAKELSSIHLTHSHEQNIQTKKSLFYSRLISVSFAISLFVSFITLLLFPLWIFIVFKQEYLQRLHRLKLIQRDRDQIAGQISKLLNADDYNRNSLPAEFGLYLRAFMTTDKLHIKGFDLETMLAYSIAPSLPLVALGQPGEHLGSGRIQTTDEHWQEEILRLMDAARLILIIPSHRAGTLWEIATLREQGYFKKTIFIMPPELEFHGGKYSEDWQKTVAAAQSVGVEFPYHIQTGAFFRLNESGEFVDYAPFVPDSFIQEYDPTGPDSGVNYDMLGISGFEADGIDHGGHIGSHDTSHGHHEDDHGGRHSTHPVSHDIHHNGGHSGGHEGHGGDHGGGDGGGHGY